MEGYKILTCAGFGTTGSSVVSDYLAEFENVDARAGDVEFRFLHDYGGVSSLEDSLVHNYQKQSSDGAIHTFLNMVDYQSGNILSKKYEHYFGGKFREFSYQYIDELCDVKWRGYLETAVMPMSPTWRMIYYQLFPRFKKLLNGWKGYIGKYYPLKDVYFASPTEEFFVECTKRYLNRLFSVLDPNHKKEYLYLDQLLPPTNIDRYLRYFDSVKVIVVDRDPRDVYVENAYYWEETFCPFDVDKFITLFKKQRQFIDVEHESRDILRINFEDAVCNYDDFCKKVNEFLGLSELQHQNPRSKFDPSRSIKNTQWWKKYDVPKEDIDKIEKELKEYCYNF